MNARRWLAAAVVVALGCMMGGCLQAPPAKDDPTIRRLPAMMPSPSLAAADLIANAEEAQRLQQWRLMEDEQQAARKRELLQQKARGVMVTEPIRYPKEWPPR